MSCRVRGALRIEQAQTTSLLDTAFGFWKTPPP
jgi:hypothetical protein